MNRLKIESVSNLRWAPPRPRPRRPRSWPLSLRGANVSIYAEEDQIRKAEAQLGKLYYRDYVVGEEMDTAEYPSVGCQKIDELRSSLPTQGLIDVRPPRCRRVGNCLRG